MTDTPSLTKALTEALASGKPALINAVIDPTAGTESGHIQSLNPAERRRPQEMKMRRRSGADEPALVCSGTVIASGPGH